MENKEQEKGEAKNVRVERLVRRFDATELWNKATKLHPLETNGYWKALNDLKELGVIVLKEKENA